MRLNDTHSSPPHAPPVPHPAPHNHHPTPPHPPNVPHPPTPHSESHQPTTSPSEPKSRSWLHWRCDYLQNYNNLFLTRPLYNTGPRTKPLHQPTTHFTSPLHSAPPPAQYALHMQKNLRVRAGFFPCGTTISMQKPHLNLATTPLLLTSTSIQPPLRK